MDVAELAARTGIPVRRLRYVFDHRVLPGLRADTPGQGIPRTFTDFEAFGIAVAARLLDTGLTRKLVAASLGAACRRAEPAVRTAEIPLLRAYDSADGIMEIGDARYLRVYASRRSRVGAAFDTGWMLMFRREAVPDPYAPGVLVTVELGRLARMVRGERPVAE